MRETAVDGVGGRWAETDPGIPKIPESTRNYSILPFRSVPRGPVGFREHPDGAPINTQHPKAADSTYIAQFR